MIWTQEHDELRRTTKAVVDTHVNPFVDQWEEEGIFPGRQVMKAFGNAGLLGIGKAAEWGGMELDFSFEIAFAEELGNIRTMGICSAIGVQTNMCTPALAKHGSDRLKAEFLAPTIAGDLVGCIGVSEASAGSDVAQLKTHARKDGGDYIINGSKMWITNGVQGDWICLLVNTDTDNGPHRNKSLIALPLDTPGITVGKKLDKVGYRSSDTALLFFDDVRISQANLIGEEGHGFRYQMEQFQEERLFVTARSWRFLDIAIEETIDYLRQRKAFGKPLLDNQYIYFKLAEMQAQIESVRALLYRALEAYLNGEDVTKLASMAKYLIGRLSMEIPVELTQFWGGQGFMNDNFITRVYREARQTAVGGGANEVMLQIIAKKMGIFPKS
ncbi:citronellyl-CoA dehydrogenase [Thalassovita litoralis]|jgi:citronellyl-CoA dehydrogenase|uniref:Citronellyl-CoA dehydrogenase n=1 Tax=Thalassovita litoralis TaxID=1010611 RepID=A0A521BMW1_9RHOB|nr:acyl-CoA dehydrogenase family protein [Thalassovita litoralis]SMO48445.1 citronellyl-CoA dehydrogenase [Thalassovita litoralis]